MGMLDWFKKNQEATNFKTPEEYYAWKEKWLENKPSEDTTNELQNKQLDNPNAKIADEVPNTSATKYFSVALACQSFKLTEHFQSLVKSANNFIKFMKKDVPYWETFPLYKANYPTENIIPSSDFSLKYNSLTIGGRLHLFEALSNHSQSLTDCSNYNLRSFGVNSIDTIEEISSSDILLIEKCIAKISPFSYLNKKELMTLLESKNIAYKKSWNTDKLFNTIIETDAKIIDEFMSDKQKERAIIKYQVNSRFKNDVDLLLKSLEENIIVYNLLCFVNSQY